MDYGTDRAAAEMTVAALTGARNVKDNIEISNDADPVDVTLNVQDALDRYSLIPDDSDSPTTATSPSTPTGTPSG